MLPLREGASEVKFSDRFRKDRSSTDPVEVAVADHQIRTGIELEITHRRRDRIWEAEDATGRTWQSSTRNRLLMTLLEYLAEQPDRA